MRQILIFIISAAALFILVVNNGHATSHTVSQGGDILSGWIFLYGVAGAFVIYAFMYRETRIMEFSKNPKKNWRILFFDMMIFLVCGGLLAMFILVEPTVKEAFMAGAGWQGIVGGFTSNLESTSLRKELSEKNESITSLLETMGDLRKRTPEEEGEEDIQEIPNDEN